ncbi:pilin [Zhongshania aquimaris]|uniref:Pilin n=1 Tax=Zhongshania aquimaris TaxID=2857107 RepID=A0ABS6VPE9_9GAMM|nr:pilin [Zhongshania aquimaris]MBW2940194.1 pilin [Zhongshania aquimaris]
MKRTQQGFTLIELMIVVAIIGILAAVALPAYQDYVSRSQAAEAMNLAGGLKIAVADSYSDKGDFDDASSGSDGIPAAASVSGKYTTSVTVATGVITATIGGDASATISGQVITLSPVTNDGSLSWNCSFDGELKYMPSSCRTAS